MQRILIFGIIDISKSWPKNTINGLNTYLKAYLVGQCPRRTSLEIGRQKLDSFGQINETPSQDFKEKCQANQRKMD